MTEYETIADNVEYTLCESSILENMRLIRSNV